MPSKTPKQARFMRMCASDKGRKSATTPCPPKKTAREFVRHDSKTPKKK